ncbi:MAG TPA: hypothetical protein VHH36_00370, partial [Candidatus Thermoplasmatota archaeon]|nr:hypothetical protein [Candidatus Thermoplasmatota archaeon]
MVLRWDPWALPGAASLLLGLAAAGFVLATRPDRPQNRWLAATIALTSALSCVVSLELAVDPRWRDWARVMLMGPTLILIPLVYLSFLATLPARLARPLRWPALRAALAAYTAVLLVAWFARPELFVERVGFRASGLFFLEPRAFVEPLLLGHLVLAGLAGAAVALSALASARAPLARRQMRVYALAFVARDLLLVVWAAQDATDRTPLWPHEWRGALLAGVDAAFILVLAYGVLSTQLFDIDRRVRAAAARVVLAATLVLAFVLATEGAEALVAEEAGAVAALAFAAALA